MIKDITGMKYGRLTAISYSHKTKSGNSVWLCECECGNVASVNVSNLLNGHTKSCGCYASESKRNRKTRTSHGMSYSRLYSIWQGMKQRCFDTNATSYQHYGGKGILVCDEWSKFEPFQKWAIENGYQDNLTIDRIESDGNYEPSNCRWVTQKEQNRNKKNNHLLTVNGQTKTLGEWSEITGLAMSTMFNRIRRGLDGKAVVECLDR